MLDRMTLLRRALVASTALALPLFAVPALAQTAPEATAPEGKKQIQEIVVTAEHRKEDISKVPMAITAMTGDQMEQQGIKDVADVAREVPGLNFQSSSDSFGSTEISIRGINASAGAATTGVYIDETPIQVRTSSFTGTSNPYPKITDLASVEVLKGPQGTLWGASSEGGTVRFITPEPDLEKWSGVVRTDDSFNVSGDPSGSINAAIGGPIIEDVLAFRASAAYEHTGGWVDRLDYKTGQTVDPNSNWGDDKVARLAVKFQPFQNFTIEPTFFYQDVYSNDTSLWWMDTGGYTPQGGAPAPQDAGRYHNLSQLQQPDDDHFDLTGLNVEYQFDWMTVKSITSWFHRTDNRYADESDYDLSTFVPYPTPSSPSQVPNGGYGYGGIYLPGGGSFISHGYFRNTQEDFSEEIRFASNDQPGDAFSWLAGIYFSHNRQAVDNTIAEPLINVANDPWVIQNFGLGCAPGACTVADLMGTNMIGPYSYILSQVNHDAEQAAYLNVTWHPIDDVSLQAGVRGSRTVFDFTEVDDGPWNAHPSNPNDPNSPYVSLSSYSATKKEYPIDPRFSASWQVTPDDMVYITAAKGYRIGGGNTNLGTLQSCRQDFENLGISGNPQTYDSDSVWSYETGAKGKFFDHSLTLDGSLFLIDWNKIQSTVYLPICGYTYTANLGSAQSKGFELTARWIATDWLTLSGNVAYTDARYTSTTVVGGTNILALKGDSLNTPPLTFTLSAEHDEDITDDVSLYSRLDYSFSSHYTRTGSDTVYTWDPVVRPGASTNDLSGRVGIATGPWDVSVYGQNLLNLHTTMYLFHDTFYSPGVRAISMTPLTLGVTASYRF